LAEQGKNLENKVKLEFNSRLMSLYMVDLLTILGDGDDGSEAFPSRLEVEALTRQFPALSKEERMLRGRELRGMYDWGTLQQVVHICPGHDAQSFKLQDLFNLLDMHIQSRHGFYVYSNNITGQRFVSPEALVLARNALVMLIGLLHFHDYHKTVQQEGSYMSQYIGFAEILTRLMQEEGERLYRQGYSFDKRQFYLFSYAIINMNWDPILLWLISNAHKNANRNNRVRWIDHPPVPLEMFYDLGYYMGVRPVDSTDINVWYPFNEAVVQRTNNLNHPASRRVRIGKIYFPHGCSCWRECPNCGKLTMYLGEEWQYASTSLFPPPLLPAFSADWRNSRSQEEAKARQRGMADVIQCVHCGTLTEFRHTPLIMQSNFKGGYAPFLEEIQRDMRIALENAQHIVLMGYTLPIDDVIYRSLLSARQKREQGPFCSVIVGCKEAAPDEWLTGKKLIEYLEKERLQDKQSSFVTAVESAQAIFPEGHVRAYAHGIPQVFLGVNQEASYDKIVDLLYPKERFDHGKVER
jgi:endogenous inhibitor of DNA gyrase (YacG/DUF329 family)